MIQHAKFAAALTLGLMMSSIASAETYICELGATQANSSAWIPPKTIIKHDPKTGRVLVIDGLIKDTYDGPIEAKISTDNAKRITFSWSVGNVRVHTTDNTWMMAKNMAYRLTIQKGSLTAIETMKAVGFRNTYRGKGKCAVK